MKIINPNAKHIKISNMKNTSFKYNGWPSICIDDRGTLYAVASSMRMSHVDPTGKNCMYVSLNEGETWSPPIVVNDSYFDDRDAGIIYLGGGKMLLNWFSLAYRDYCDPIQSYDWFDKVDQAISGGFSEAWKRLPEETFKAGTGSFVKLSNDYGFTWSDPIRVPVTAPHGPNLCQDGRLVYLGSIMGENDRPMEERPPLALYTSYDDGLTWEKTGEVPNGDEVTAMNMVEPHVVELNSGRLLGAIRIDCPEITPSFTVFTTYSDDKGKTWSKPRPTGLDGSPPHLTVHSSGAVILSYSCRTNGERCERAAVSYDGGETWTEDYALDDRLDFFCDMGYPATTELPDKSLITVYYQKWPGEWWTSVICSKWKLGDANQQ